MIANRLVNKIKLKKLNNINTSHDEAELIISFMDEAVSHWDKSLEDECKFERRLFFEAIGKIPDDDIKAIKKVSEYMFSLANKIRILYYNSAWKTLWRYIGIMAVADATIGNLGNNVNSNGKYDDVINLIYDEPGYDDDRHGKEAFEYWDLKFKRFESQLKRSLKNKDYPKIAESCFNLVGTDMYLAFVWPPDFKP